MRQEISVRQQRLINGKICLDFDAASRCMLDLPEEVNHMEYSIRALSELAGVSARTLRYYDEIGLLKPKYVNEAGYRYYGEKELTVLQQILFYRERDLDLKQIQKILYQDDFDIIAALEEHLLELEEQRKRTNALIRTVKKTILSMKGEYEMSDKEKFEAFKARIIEENEETYGKEIRKKYGDDVIDASNGKILNMSKENWENFQTLEKDILARLKEGVESGIAPDSEAAKKIVALHKEWLGYTWKQYTPQAHKGVAAVYVSDERFKNYYDREAAGCAELLRQAVDYWADR